MRIFIILLNKLSELYSLCLVLYALLSWFPGGYESGVGRFLTKICEPYLKIFDRFNLSIGPLSFTIVIAVIVLNLVTGGLTKLLFNIFLI